MINSHCRTIVTIVVRTIKPAASCDCWAALKTLLEMNLLRQLVRDLPRQVEGAALTDNQQQQQLKEPLLTECPWANTGWGRDSWRLPGINHRATREENKQRPDHSVCESEAWGVSTIMYSWETSGVVEFIIVVLLWIKKWIQIINTHIHKMKFQYSSAKSCANLDSLKQRLTDQITKHHFIHIYKRESWTLFKNVINMF